MSDDQSNEPDLEIKQIPDEIENLKDQEARSNNVDSKEKAQKEAVALADGTLEDLAKAGEHTRNEKIRNAVGTAGVWVVWILFIIVVAAVITVSWHYIMPEKWTWLTPQQVSDLKGPLIGAGTGFAGAYFKKRL